MVEMERIDICCEVSALSSCLTIPRQGHLQQALHIFAYLKCHHNSRIIMDPAYPDILIEDFPKYDWAIIMILKGMNHLLMRQLH